MWKWLSVESGGVLIDRFTTPLDVFRRDTFAATVARLWVAGVQPEPHHPLRGLLRGERQRDERDGQ